MNNCYPLENRIECICRCDYKYFLSKPNVIGVGIGYKVVNSFNTFKKCIKVLVNEKYNDSNMKNLVPPIYKGIQTDIQESSIPTVASLNGRIRPVIGGYGMSPVNKPVTGTMTCVVTDNHDNFILANNHLLADCNKLPLGTAIIQPSVIYGGKSPKDIVAGLSEFVPVKKGQAGNFVDCAIARILNKKTVSPKVAFVGHIKGVASAKLGDKVKKVGATTEFTDGEVTIVKTMMFVNFDGVMTVFEDQIVTTKMTDKGDSGGILLNSQNYAIGLMMSQTLTNSIFNNFSRALKELNVLLVK